MGDYGTLNLVSLPPSPLSQEQSRPPYSAPPLFRDETLEQFRAAAAAHGLRVDSLGAPWLGLGLGLGLGVTPLFHNVGHIALRAHKSPKACSMASGSSII